MTMHVLLPVLLAVLGVAALVFGAPRMGRALRDPERDGAPLLLLHGARWALAGAALLMTAAGLLWQSKGLTVLGLVFLGEEMYETTVVLAALKWGRQRGMV